MAEANRIQGSRESRGSDHGYDIDGFSETTNFGFSSALVPLMGESRDAKRGPELGIGAGAFKMDIGISEADRQRMGVIKNCKSVVANLSPRARGPSGGSLRGRV